MFEFTLKIDPAVAELLGLDGDSIIEAFYDPDEDEIVIRVLDEDELDGEFNDPPPAMAVRCSARNTESASSILCVVCRIFSNSMTRLRRHSISTAIGSGRST